MADNMTDEGGYPIPDRIIIWIIRLRLLQILADRAESGKAYWIDRTGIVFGMEIENEKINQK